MSTTTRALVALPALCAAALLTACAGRSTPSTRSTDAAGTTGIVLDGNISEWPQDAAGVADGRYLYSRFTIAGDEYALEAGPKTLVLYFDTDGNPATGLSSSAAPIPEAAGADLEIRFSPRTEEGALKEGVALSALDSSGKATAIRAADADFSFAPTYAAGWYEARLSRRLPRIGGLPGLASGGGRVRGVVVLFDGNGALDGYADPFEVTLPPLGSAALAAADIPGPPPGSVRVMTYNVFKRRPVDRPDAFARIFKAVAPDVVLLQEWDQGDADEIKAWFVTMVPSGPGWQTIVAPSGDVAIVSRYPLSTLGIDNLQLPGADGKPRAVRFVGATTTTPAGDLVVGSTHLKCCGGKGSAEDATRAAESQAINAALRRALAGKSALRIIGGDLNLVATRPPLDHLAEALDPSGGNLTVVDAPVLGDPGVFYTWSDPKSEFSASRLDFLMFSGSAAQAVQSFVLDTSRLSDPALARHNLHSDDTRQSDHLPLVVDIVPNTP